MARQEWPSITAAIKQCTHSFYQLSKIEKRGKNLPRKKREKKIYIYISKQKTLEVIWTKMLMAICG